jgi:hypothetical protein
MSEKPHREEPSYGTEHVDPPYVPNVRRPGDEGSKFRTAPLAEPKAQQRLLAFLGTNGVTVLMGGLVAVVVVVVIVLLVTKA